MFFMFSWEQTNFTLISNIFDKTLEKIRLYVLFVDAFSITAK